MNGKAKGGHRRAEVLSPGRRREIARHATQARWHRPGATEPVVIVFDVDPRYVRAARALLGWSQGDLARAAEIAISTLADYERGSRRPHGDSMLAIRRALERRGIVFLEYGVVETPDSSPQAPQRSWLYLP